MLNLSGVKHKVWSGYVLNYIGNCVWETYLSALSVEREAQSPDCGREMYLTTPSEKREVGSIDYMHKRYLIKLGFEFEARFESI